MTDNELQYMYALQQTLLHLRQALATQSDPRWALATDQAVSLYMHQQPSAEWIESIPSTIERTLSTIPGVML